MHQWSTTPAANGSADARAYLVEGSTTVAGLNNAQRGAMATAALWRDDNLGVSLTATAGANNLYTLTTGQGLIDPTTVSGTPAITHPFSLRIQFSATPSGLATNPLRIVIDGAAAAPVTKADGTALVDGDIVTGRSYPIIGTTFASNALTGIIVATLLPSDIQAGSVGQCRLGFTSSTAVTLAPIGSGRLIVNGASVTVPAGGVALSNSGLLAADPTSLSPFYYVYAYVGASGLALEASTTGHATGLNGVEVKSGDATRTLVGMVALDGTAGSQGSFADTATKRYVASYFNRRARPMSGASPTTVATSSSTFTEMSLAQRLTFLTWGDEACHLAANGQTQNLNDQSGEYSALGIDGTTPFTRTYNSFIYGGFSYNASLAAPVVLSEGLHYATVLIATNGSGTANFNMQTFATVRN